MSGEVVDQAGRIGEVRTVGDCGNQAIAADTAIEQVGEAQRHPMRFGDSGLIEESVKQGVETLLGLTDQLWAERGGHWIPLPICLVICRRCGATSGCESRGAR